MPISEEQLQEWARLAHTCDHSIELRYAFSETAEKAIPALIAELREARRKAELPMKYKRMAFNAELQEEIQELRANLAEAKKGAEHWKSNHASVVAKLRLFTQREDLPVDRLPAYAYVLELERKLTESQARTAQVLSVAEKMRCAGGAQEFQYWFDELKSFLLHKRDAPMLDAAIAEKEKP